MKPSLLLSSAAAALMLAFAANAQAETAYGLMSGYPTWNVCSYDFSQLGQTKAEKLFEVPFSDVQSACSVGDYYYVYATIADPETYMDNLVFASVNMETQQTVVVKEFGDVWGEDGFVIRDLVSIADQLCGLKDNNVWDEAAQAMVYRSDLVLVDVSNGSFETICTVDGNCWGLTADDNNLYLVKPSGMSGWSYLIDLFTLQGIEGGSDQDWTLKAVTDNQNTGCSEVNPSHAVTAPDGAVYFFSGSTPYKMQGGVEALGSVTSYQSYTGTTFVKSSKSAEPCGEVDEKPDYRVLTTLSSYGDFMGMAPDTQITSQKHYFYNDKLQLVAVVETACGAKSSELYTQYYSPYVYNEEGQLIKRDHYQYGLYDYGDRTMHQAAGVVEYRYDEKGNCIEEIEDQNSIAYEYDADGNCIKEVRMQNGSVGKTILYSGFEAGRNKPSLVSATHTNDSFTGEFYDESREYDALGHLVKAVRVCNRDYVEDHGIWQITTAYGDFMQEEHWTYDGKQLMLYEKFTNMDEETGELLPYLKTVYTVKDDHTVGLQSYTAYGNEWYKSGVYQEETYSDFSGMTSATAVKLLKAERDDNGLNDARIEFSLPQIANVNPNIAFNVYRNGEFVRTLELLDAIAGSDDFAFDEATGHLVFTDRHLCGGQYDYFVQLQTMEGFGGDLPVEGEAQGQSTTYCASNIIKADMTLNFELPAATNLKAVESVKDKNDNNYVTIRFDAPQAPAEYEFICNELMLGNSQIGEETSVNPANNVLHCTIGDDTAYVYVLTRYYYGKAFSEKLHVDVNHLDSLDEIRALDQNSLMIFDLNGRQVDAPLESLHGQYVVVSGHSAYKVMLK